MAADADGRVLCASFKSLRFLLVDSKVPRDTKKLVAGVALKKLEVRLFSLRVSISAKCLLCPLVGP